MDGLAWITATGPTINFAGEMIPVHGRTLADYGLMEAEILRQRRCPFDLIRRIARVMSHLPQMEEDVIPPLFDTAMTRWCRVSPHELLAWMNTWKGRIFTLWLAIGKNDSCKYTIDFITRQAVSLNWPNVLRAVEQASGTDERAQIEWFNPHEGTCRILAWPEIYQRLAQHPFGMSADEISRLTLHQLNTLLTSSENRTTRVQFDSPEQLAQWQVQLTKNKATAAGNLIQGLRWDSCPVRTPW